MSRFVVRCQLCLVNFVNSARLPCAARWGGWVADCRIELPMALTQTVFLFYNVPVAISRLLVLSLRNFESEVCLYSVLNWTRKKLTFSESMV